MIDLCQYCQQIRYLRNPKFKECERCSANRLEKVKLEKANEEFKSISSYNQHLWDLYFTYVTHRKPIWIHTRQTLKLKEILETHIISPVISSWEDVHILVKKFDKDFPKHRKSPSPFIKIGRMLQELKIIPIRGMTCDHQLNNQLSYFTNISIKEVQGYADTLIRNRRSLTTTFNVVYSLKKFHLWVSIHYPHINWMQIQPDICTSHLLSIDNERSRSSRYSILKMFFSWAKVHKYIVDNPFDKISTPVVRIQKLTVCSDEQIKKIRAFIKNPNFDTEAAMILTLVLFFGFSLSDLTYATIEFQNERLIIYLNKRPHSFATRNKRDSNAIQLPHKPDWFMKLQKRYLIYWQKRYDQIRKEFDNPILLLPKHNWHNRPLPIINSRERFYQATRLACGEDIPPHVLRQTCGLLHLKFEDGFAMTKLGWSRQSSTKYVFLPKIVYHRSKKS